MVFPIIEKPIVTRETMVEIELLHAREEKKSLEKKLVEEAQNIKRLLSEKSQLKAVSKHRLQKQD